MAEITNITPQELIEAQRIARIKQEREKIRARLSNAKTRTMGVDIPFIQQQIQEKQDNKMRDREEVLREADQLQNQAKAFNHMAQAAEEDVKKGGQELREYWRQQSERKKADDLKRRSQDDTPLDFSNQGVSSAQNFAGGDEAFETRRRVEQAKTRNFHQQEMACKAQRNELEEQEKRDWAMYNSEIVKKRQQLEDEQAREARQRNLDFQAENRKLAEEKAARALQAQQQLADDNALEITQQLSLTETHGRAAAGYRTDYRGLDKAAAKTLREEQLQQIQDKKDRADREKHEERSFLDSQSVALSELNQREQAVRDKLKTEKQQLWNDWGSHQGEAKNRNMEQSKKQEIGHQFFSNFGQADA